MMKILNKIITPNKETEIHSIAFASRGNFKSFAFSKNQFKIPTNWKNDWAITKV